MQLHALHRAFSDPIRLRILHLLLKRPLCVCHLQALLHQPQVRISKHLATLRTRGILHATRHRNWSIYQIPGHPAEPLASLLNGLLQHGARTKPFSQDLVRLKKLEPELSRFDSAGTTSCPLPASVKLRKP